MRKMLFIFIVLFIKSSAHAQLIEPEFVLTFKVWENTIPIGYYHDMSVGPDKNIYVAVESGIYRFYSESDTFNLIPGTEDILINASPSPRLLPMDDGELIFTFQSEFRSIIDGEMNTLPLLIQTDNPNFINKISGLKTIAAKDVNKIFFSASHPINSVGPPAIYIRHEDGRIEHFAGGGRKEISDEPINKFDAEIAGIHDLYIFEDNTIAYSWLEVINRQPNFNNIAIITPDEMISLYISYKGDMFSRTFATKSHLFFDAGTNPENTDSNLIKLLTPNIDEPINIAEISHTNRGVRFLYMDYSTADDALYVLAEEVDRLVLWKVPNVLSTLQSHAKGWEIYK